MSEEEGRDAQSEKTDVEITTPEPTTEGTQPAVQSPEGELDKKFADMEQKFEEKWVGKYKGLQGVIKDRNKEIRRLKQKDTIQPQASTTHLDTLKLMAGNLEALSSEGGITSPNTAKIKQMIHDEEQNIAYTKQVDAWQGKCAEERNTIEDMVEKAGIDIDDERLYSAWDKFDIAMYQTGKFDAAKERFGTILNKIKPKEESEDKKVEAEKKEDKPKVTDEERIEAKALELLKSNPAFKTHDGSPSGAGSSDDEFIKKFSTGELNTPDDIKRAQEILNKLK